MSRNQTQHADLEAEDALLASALLDPTTLDLIDALEPDEFYRAGAGAFFDAMRRLHRRGEPVDNVTLRAELVRRGAFERSGGDEYLVALGNRMPNPDAVEAYADRVRELAAVRRVRRAAQDTLTATAGPIEDVATFLGDTAQRTVEACTDPQADAGMSALGDLSEVVRAKAREREERKGMSGVTSGLRGLDALVGGYEPGHLIVVGGRPGMGKSALAQCTAVAAARASGPVLIFSLEMTKDDWATRLALAESRVSGTKHRNGTMTKPDWAAFDAALDRSADLPITIDDRPRLTPHQLRARARRYQAKHGLSLVVVDYMQLMRTPDVKEQREEAHMAEVSKSLKELAKELRVPVLALAQLNREVERAGGDRRPEVHHLRNSGQIEQDADLIAFVYREWVYDDTADELAAEVLVRKNRAGRTGVAKARFTGECFRFEDWDFHAAPTGQRAMREHRRDPEPWDAEDYQDQEGFDL